MEDRLLSAETEEDCLHNAEQVLETQQLQEYHRVFADSPKAAYLGKNSRKGRDCFPLTESRQLLRSQPLRHRDNPGVPRAGGFCRLWILRFAELAKPLYVPLGALEKLSLVSSRETGL